MTLFSADVPDWPQKLLQMLRPGGFSFALTMSGIGVDLTVDGKPMWEAAKVPLFNWSCDHPCYFPGRHGIRSTHLLHGYVFPDHARYNIRYLKPMGRHSRDIWGFRRARYFRCARGADGAKRADPVHQERG